MILGCDISYAQGDIDLQAQQLEGKQFTIIKATDGLSEIDSWFHTNVAKAQALKMPFGVYHFFHPNRDPAQQAQFFMRVTAGLNVPRWIDHEISGGLSAPEQIESAQKFMSLVPNCKYYSYLAFIESLRLPASFAKADLWLAEYSRSYSSPAPWQGVNNAKIWQNGTSGGLLDTDEFQGTQEEMQAYFAAG